IAIPVLLLFQWLSTRADRAIDHIDEAGSDFIVNHTLPNGTIKKSSKKSAAKNEETGSVDDTPSAEAS
ncbi:MAG: hypothetical protein HOD72_06650, partial [Opitutae bacterium]|nr:hypothetical protein [Opitutae bacterium]